MGAVVVGGSQASNPQAQFGSGGKQQRKQSAYRTQSVHLHRSDCAHQGTPSIDVGAWFQRFQSNEEIALSQYGQMTFTGLPTFLTGTASFLYDPTPTPMSWRSLFGAWYVEDIIRVRSNLTVTLGFRDEFSTGWNEAHGRASKLHVHEWRDFACQPDRWKLPVHSQSREIPAAAAARHRLEPVGPKTVIRAGFGMYNDLQDALGYRADQNAPFNPTYTIAAAQYCESATFRSNPAPRRPGQRLLVPGGVQPDMYTPTVNS